MNTSSIDTIDIAVFRLNNGDTLVGVIADIYSDVINSYYVLQWPLQLIADAPEGNTRQFKLIEYSTFSSNNMIDIPSTGISAKSHCSDTIRKTYLNIINNYTQDVVDDESDITNSVSDSDSDSDSSIH